MKLLRVLLLFSVVVLWSSCATERPLHLGTSDTLYVDTIYGRFIVLLEDTVIHVKDSMRISAVANETNSFPKETAKAVFIEGDLFLMHDQYEKSEQYYRRALEIGLEYREELGNRFVAECYNRMGLIFQETHNLGLAIKAFEQSAKYYELNGNESEVMKAYLNIGNSYAVIGYNFDLAIEYLAKAKELLDNLDNGNTPEIQQMKLHLRNAKANAHSTDALLNRLLGNYKVMDSQRMIALEEHKGLYNIMQSNYPEQAWTILAANNIAIDYHQLGNGEKCVFYATQALNNANDFSGYPLVAHTYLLRGLGYLSQDNLEQSLKDNTKGLNILGYPIREDLDIPKIDREKINHGTYLLSGLRFRTQLFKAYYDKENDRKYLTAIMFLANEAISFLNEKRASSVLETTISYTEMVGDIFHSAADAAYQLYQLNGSSDYLNASFEYIENSKNYALLQELKSQYLLQYKEEARSLNKTLSLLRNNIERNPNSIEATQSLRDFVSKLRSSTIQSERRFYEENFGSSAISIAEIQKKLLGKDVALLEFDMRGEKGRCIVLTKNSEKVVELSVDKKDLFDKIRRYNQATGGTFGKNENDLGVAHDLYLSLFKPIENELPNHIKRLIIIPDIMLYDLVFDNLISRMPREMDKRSISYLFKKYAISYDFSASIRYLYTELNANKQKAKYEMGLFISRFDQQFEDETFFEERCNNIQLDKLHVAALKSRNIIKKEDHKTLKFDPAYEKDFYKYANQCKIVHFSTHGCLNTLSPSESNLLFTYRKRNQNSDVLTAQEIKNTYLEATELAILINCDTNQGVKKVGEGTLSISRAFFTAGCPSVIASTRKIPADAAPIVVLIYKHLAQGHPKDVAIQLAKKEYLLTAEEGFLSPVYWGNIILIGSSERL